VSKRNVIIAIVVLGVLYFGLDKLGYLPGTIKQESAVPQAVDLSAGADINESARQQVSRRRPSAC
jgi:hypothetical protein